MGQKSWSWFELYPKADLIAYLLMHRDGITGVALSGSIAQEKPEGHDIDLVAFHNGTLPDGSYNDPVQIRYGVGVIRGALSSSEFSARSSDGSHRPVVKCQWTAPLWTSGCCGIVSTSSR